LTSELHDAKGIGQKTVEKLLRTFGSLERVKLASDEELTAAVGKTAAGRVRAYLAASIPGPGLVQLIPDEKATVPAK
jgi:excinuclease ABC subunit C